MSGQKGSQVFTKVFFQNFYETLQTNPRNTSALVDNVFSVFGEAKERQIYKLLHPFAVHKCKNELYQISQQEIVEPILNDSFRMLRYPNAISMYLQSYGNQFVTDGGKRKTREEVEAEKASGIRPFKFNVFHQVAREVNNRLDYFQESTDYEMIISLLNNFVLNNTFEQQTIITLASSLREKCNQEILEKLHTNKIFTLAKNLRFIKLHYGDESFEEYEAVVRGIADRHREQ
jgi:hypothetical protein